MKQLQRNLAATAAAHKPGDTRQLRDYAHKAIELIENQLPFHPGEDIRADLRIAHRGMVKQKTLKVKKPPVLNVEDLLEY